MVICLALLPIEISNDMTCASLDSGASKAGVGICDGTSLDLGASEADDGMECLLCRNMRWIYGVMNESGMVWDVPYF
jgi:hypothetical protein